MWGLYFSFSIVLIYFPIITIYFLIRGRSEKSKFKLISFKRYFRYIKIYFKFETILIIIVSSIISNTIIIFQNKKYENAFQDGEQINAIAVVIGRREEKEYQIYYKIELNNKYLYLSVNKKRNIELEYGDKIQIKSTYKKPSKQRNSGGFDYEQYLRTKKIYGTLETEEIKIIEHDKGNKIIKIANIAFDKISAKIDNLLEKEQASILKGILLGDTSKIEDEIRNKFSNSNISHILAVSGLHVSYIILGFNLLLEKIAGKNKTRIAILFGIVFYIILTDFSFSVIRAGAMAMLGCIAKLVKRKSDTINNLSFSLLFILLDNPHAITNIGLQLSFAGTVGILLFNPIILKIVKGKEIISVILSAQIVILPLSIYHFNTIGIYFLISNILISMLIGLVIIFGFCLIIISFILYPLANFLSPILKIGLNIITSISNIGELPFAKIYLPTLSIWQIILYYLLITIFQFLYFTYKNTKPTITQIRVKNLVALFKYYIKENKKKCKNILLVLGVFICIINIFPRDLKIHFVDVGQGDCTFIETPMHQTILIDGGGSEASSFDVGEQTLLPYLLDKGYTKIDYIFISHFDQDHVGGILTILKELRVGEVIFPEQIENSDNYKKFIEIVKEKEIQVKKVKKGDVVNIEKDLHFEILWPSEEQITENILNNNSMVSKLKYKNFSMLFTGDIEEIAESQILEKYRNTDALKSTVLKVAHHGSKTSTTKEFLEAVNPSIALIGVGENNNFGHPNGEVIERLNNVRCKYL